MDKRYRYRTADGSFNNIYNPRLGAAGSAYARSVKPITMQQPNLPDPGDIFDRLLARSQFEAHPLGISSMLYYMATLIIHDLFSTSRADNNINESSSYLDLSTLYGRNEDEQKAVRTFQDGLLKPDTFSSVRILSFPPGCSVLLVMFNRFHNYVVTQLAMINEGGRFTKPGEGAPAKAWDQYDEDLFQTGRLVTCGLYVNIILRDYVRTFLALNRTGHTFSLDPRIQENIGSQNKPSSGGPIGAGNQTSVEFNLLYRWHSSVSPRDEKWTEDFMSKILPPGVSPETASMEDLMRAMGTLEATIPKEPEDRTFGGLRRLEDGTFSDDELVAILTESTEDLAGAFGAHTIPKSLRAIEMLGIMQARYWNVATLNEFRQFVGLTRHASFEDINPDPTVADQLRNFYESPDSVELYPGLLAEKTKPPIVPGSGLCGNFTTTFAILTDAISLGHVMYKLILRAFPRHYRGDSIYAHFPFVIPSENKKILDALKTSYLYSWEVPKYQPSQDFFWIKSYDATTKILENHVDFKVPWAEGFAYALSADDGTVYGLDFPLTGDSSVNFESRRQIGRALYPPMSDWHAEIASCFEMHTKRLLRQYGYPANSSKARIKTFEIDLVRDVVGPLAANFAADLFSIPIKNAVTPAGVFSEHQLYLALMISFISVFNVDVANSLKLRIAGREAVQQIGQLLLLDDALIAQGAIVETLKTHFVNLVNRLRHHSQHVNIDNIRAEYPTMRLYGDHFIERLMKNDTHHKTLAGTVWGVITPTVAAATGNMIESLTDAVDYYLDRGKEHLPKLYELAHANTKEADSLLEKYLMEALRLRGSVATFRNVATDRTIEDYDPVIPDPSDPTGLYPLPNPDAISSKRTLHLKAGQRVLTDFVAAGHDPLQFPEPDKVRLDRPLDKYLTFGWGQHQCLGLDATRAGMTAALKALVGLKNLRRADGPRGKPNSIQTSVWKGQVGSTRNPDIGWKGQRTFLQADGTGYWLLPTTMKIRWDED
ncbi:hypothetical protein VTK73DRAFT_7992 [Phialemonium thermophilum]|uniref:linoleate 8R-lipoxygenase n=1 Tax=Phialemonium thermophilum TaxID=223376 RepID=A0ABR3WB18_9PEZI